MLTVTIPKMEFFDDNTQMFSYYDGGVLKLEHSLFAIRNWEARWKIPFLESDEKTYEQIKDYVRCMTVCEVKDPNIYHFLTKKNLEEIIRYIKDPMTATWFRQGIDPTGKMKSSSEKVTAEIVYYWMVTLNIPFELERWNFNQLMTLIRVCGVKSNNHKVDPKQAAIERARLNEQRKAKYKTRG